jgi:uracil-DNA glycosylase family 4
MINLDILSDLRSQVEICTRCKLSKTRTKTVFGSILPTSPLMAIGEAPGENEDLTGKEFIGRSGQRFDFCLSRADWERTNTSVINVLKCRPPNNDDPELDQITSCENYLKQQVLIVKPKVIIGLGRFATAYVLGEPFDKLKSYKISAVRGKALDIDFHGHHTILVPTWHPAYTFGKRDEYIQLQQDIALAVSLVKQ